MDSRPERGESRAQLCQALFRRVEESVSGQADGFGEQEAAKVNELNESDYIYQTIRVGTSPDECPRRPLEK